MLDDGVTRRRFLTATGAALGMGLLGGVTACGSGDSSSGGGKGGGEVVVLTWGDPQKSKLLGNAFKQRTGISLRLVPGDNSADFYNKVKVGGLGVYDVVISNVGYVPLYEEAGLVETLHLGDFAAADQLYPQFRSDLRFDYLKAPDQALAFPNQWGVYGMTYRVTGDASPTAPMSWEELWRVPKGKALLSSYYVNDLALAGRMVGLPWDDVFAMDGADLERAKNRLLDLKPFQNPASGESQVGSFVNGAVDAGLVYSLGFGTHVNQKAGKDIVRSVVPTEGVFGALDGQMLLKKAPNRDNALKWIDFCGSKEAQLIFWDLDRGPTSNRAATEAIVARGGADAADLKAQQGDQPEIAAAMAQQRDPDHPEAWTKAWDQVLAG